MKQDEELDFLLKELISKNDHIHESEIPETYEEKRRLLRALMNITSPVELSDEYYEIQNKILCNETREKDLISADEIKAIDENDEILSKIAHYQGDILNLKVDAIVNAANSQMLGCFIPLHNCIDNQIHSQAGYQLRMECNKIMKEQGHAERVGTAKITKGYNLASKYVIHTVGPAIPNGRLPNENEEKQLASCYRSCLQLADMKGLKSIAFCSISTGVFNFPKEEASELAIKTVKEYLKEHKDTILEKVIFNTFSDYDSNIYRKNLYEN